MDGTLYLDFPDISNTSDDFLKFNSTFEKENGEVANAVFNFKTNYNAIKVIFDAIMEVGPDSTKVKDFIYKYDRPSATGRLRFDSSGDAIDLNLSLKTFKAKS
jgi:ABC-type branched-subunit amino acid transport system substrate-binding protein